MTISTYAELQTAVISWANRTGDTAFTAAAPDFIKLAEVRFNRILRTTDMEETLASTALSSGAVALPTGFLAFKELRYTDGTDNWTLQAKPLEWIRAQTIDTGSPPRFFAVTGSNVVCWPENGSIRGTYYKEVPALASNSTNWLLTRHPDLYLFASLVEAALWMQDDSRIPLWAEKAAALIDAVQRSDDKDSFDGGILAVRAR